MAAPLIDPKFLTHPYDKRVMIEGMRETMMLLSAPVYSSKTVQKLFPKDDSDEKIWQYIRHNCFSSWHMSGTVCMGTDSTSSCVDSNFRIFGIEKLRVVDLSVCPFVPNSHTQSTAYVLGEMAAQKLINEYDLQKKTNMPAVRL
jgi:choline dehydrogenase-like flavoprotein